MLTALALGYFFGGGSVLVAVGLASDVKRWLKGREQAPQRDAEALGRIVH